MLKLYKVYIKSDTIQLDGNGYFLRINKQKIRTKIQEFNIAPLHVRVLKKTSYGNGKYSPKYIFQVIEK